MFDFGFGPRDDIAVTTNEAHGHFDRFFLDGNLTGAFERALEDERLCNVVRVVLDEGFFDEEIEVVLAELQIATALHLVHERGGNAMRNGRDEGAVLLRENTVLRLFAGDEKVGERLANGVGDVSEREVFFLSATCDDDFRNGCSAVAI